VKASIDISSQGVYFVRMSYENGQVEAALARTCGIADEDRAAFRARLRHLRNLGIPKIEKVGSGKRAQFSKSDAIMMGMALELSSLGVKPRFLVHLAELAIKQPGAVDPPPKGEIRDVYLIISKQGHIAYTLKGMLALATQMSSISVPSFIVMNLSGIAREVIAELK
jgi:hypothetical protein